jgi:hypothetical protein
MQPNDKLSSAIAHIPQAAKRTVFSKFRRRSRIRSLSDALTVWYLRWCEDSTPLGSHPLRVFMSETALRPKLALVERTLDPPEDGLLPLRWSVAVWLVLAGAAWGLIYFLVSLL